MRARPLTTAAALSALLCSACVHTTARAEPTSAALPGVVAAAPAGRPAGTPAPSTAERQLLDALNRVRAQGVTCPGSGVRPVAGALAYSGAHAQAARLQAGYMTQTGRVTHTGAGGSTPRVRAASTGVDAVSVTEIIYMNAGVNPEQAMQWWVRSAVHCYWMTERRYTRAGASVIRGARGTAYVIVLSSDPR